MKLLESSLGGLLEARVALSKLHCSGIRRNDLRSFCTAKTAFFTRKVCYLKITLVMGL